MAVATGLTKIAMGRVMRTIQLLPLHAGLVHVSGAVFAPAVMGAREINASQVLPRGTTKIATESIKTAMVELMRDLSLAWAHAEQVCVPPPVKFNVWGATWLIRVRLCSLWWGTMSAMDSTMTATDKTMRIMWLFGPSAALVFAGHLVDYAAEMARCRTRAKRVNLSQTMLSVTRWILTVTVNSMKITQNQWPGVASVSARNRVASFARMVDGWTRVYPRRPWITWIHVMVSMMIVMVVPTKTLRFAEAAALVASALRVGELSVSMVKKLTIVLQGHSGGEIPPVTVSMPIVTDSTMKATMPFSAHVEWVFVQPVVKPAVNPARS
jgi:hypothetical protein